jgi:uncharacterized protein with von Willebrand factor type A (vWA) domain
MDQRIAQFIAALRASGVRVSLAESADAFKAIEEMGVKDRDTFRISLRTTLVKEAKDLETLKIIPDVLPIQPAAADDGCDQGHVAAGCANAG